MVEVIVNCLLPGRVAPPWEMEQQGNPFCYSMKVNLAFRLFFFSFFLSQISIFYFELSLSGWTCGLWHWRHVPEEMYLALGSAALPSCVMIQGEIIWQGSRSIALASWSVFSAQPIDSSTRTGPQQGQRNIKRYLKMMVIFWSPNLFHGLLHAHYLHRIFHQKRISFWMYDHIIDVQFFEILVK